MNNSVFSTKNSGLVTLLASPLTMVMIFIIYFYFYFIISQWN